MDAIDYIYLYLLGTPYMGITYIAQELDLAGFVDMDQLGCLDTQRLTTGQVYILASGPISQSAKRQNIMALSIIEVEYITAAKAVKEALQLKRFINNLNTSI